MSVVPNSPVRISPPGVMQHRGKFGGKRSLYTKHNFAPVAQLDSASVFGTEGYRFESCRAYSCHIRTYDDSATSKIGSVREVVREVGLKTRFRGGGSHCDSVTRTFHSPLLFPFSGFDWRVRNVPFPQAILQEAGRFGKTSTIVLPCVMRISASRIIFCGNDQIALMLNHSFRIMYARNALRRFA